MASAATTRATLADLSREKGKAELIDGRIIHLMPTGDLPSLVSGEIFVSLRAFTKLQDKGKAYPVGIGYAVSELPSGRESFSPDASYYEGLHPMDRMRFLQGPPKFAAEVRSESDYGPVAEVEMAAKRADYFLAGTLVLWGVDPKAETVAVYRATAPTQPVIFRSGDIAEAEPAVPGWTMAVEEIFAA